ncbi:MAG TPA: hypothetical protein VHL79_07840 [Ramlibacter sp.]|jgi:hypothetical protein|nr:hypothetical protein [Ramlibacter sp.]
MRTPTLLPIRRLLAAARRSADANPASCSSPDLIYRLRSWPRLKDAVRTAEVYRMLSLMSNQPLSRRWLQSHSSMTPQQLDTLLAGLAREGALEVIDPSRFGAEPAVALQGAR